MRWINVNGIFFTDVEPVLLSTNRSYRYGDGLFETMKVINRSIALKELHFDRFFNGLKTLEYLIQGSINKDWLENEIIKLCDKNELADARVRLSAWSGEGTFDKAERPFNFLIECSPVRNIIITSPGAGLRLGVFNKARKAIDTYSNLKSASFLVYVLAAKNAINNHWDDCLILNTDLNIADSTKANIFIIKEGKIYTPPLSDGCVAGVTRQYLMQIVNSDFLIIEKSLTLQDIEQADEVFLTNAIRGIQWVQQFNDVVYTNKLTLEINDHFYLSTTRIMSVSKK